MNFFLHCLTLSYILHNMLRVFCENWQGRAKGVIILVLSSGQQTISRAKLHPNLKLLWKYCIASKALLSILLILLFFSVDLKSGWFLHFNYYFFNISISPLCCKIGRQKTFVARLSRGSYMAFHWSTAWPYWHPLKWNAKTVNFFGGEKSKVCFDASSLQQIGYADLSDFDET